jgi:predicted permease
MKAMMRMRRRALADLDRDIRDHLERIIQDNIDRGLPPDEARRQAMLQFGNIALVKEDTRAVWDRIWFEQLLQDAWYSLRKLRGNPGFAVVVVLTLALGIGMNTAVFSIFSAVLLRSVSYPDADRLVWISLSGDVPFNAIPLSEFLAWREQATSLANMVAYENTQDHTLQTSDSGTQVRTVWVSEDFWVVAGVHAALGRLPTAGDADIIVLSYPFFERWFRADPHLVGSVVTVNGRQVTIAGVLAADFRFQFPQEALGAAFEPRLPDIYRPYPVESTQQGSRGLPSASRQPDENVSGIPVRVVAKLKEDLTLDQAKAELDAIRSRLAETSPNPRLDRAALNVIPLHEKVVSDTRRVLWILLAAVTFVLLIACANVGHLLLARASARQRELAVRVSLGAGRARLLRQLMAENLVPALLGGACGLIVAQWGIATILRLLPPERMPHLADVTVIDERVLAFTFATAILTALLPVIVAAGVLFNLQPRDVLGASARAASAARNTLRARNLLVACELALAVVLLTGAGLMMKSFWRMQAHPPGFEPEQILTMKVIFTPPRYLNPVQRISYVEEFLRRLEAVPGVEAAGISATGGVSPLVHVIPEGRPRVTESEPPPTTHLYATSAGYRRAMGLRLVRGRWFADNESSAAVVISESVARREFGDEDAIGRRIQLAAVSRPGAPAAPAIPIIGVVEDIQYSRLDARPDPHVFIPYSYYSRGFARFTAVVRMSGDPMTAADEVRAHVSDIDRTLPVFDVMTLEQVLADSIAPRRFNLFLLGTFAAVALVLALIGIYGVVAQAVAQRTQEIGIRIALGARRFDLIRMVLQQGIRVVMVGVVVGLVGAFALTRVASSLLYDVQATDLPTFAAVVAVLMSTAFVACCGAALRASIVDPVVALRSE